MNEEHNYNIRNARYANLSNSMVEVVLDHPEFGEIPYGYNPNTPDQSLDSIIREALETLEIASFEEYIPSQEDLDGAELQECYTYLTSTDWVISKLSEAIAIGEDATSLLEKYETTINERRAKRTRINELEIAVIGE